MKLYFLKKPRNCHHIKSSSISRNLLVVLALLLMPYTAASHQPPNPLTKDIPEESSRIATPRRITVGDDQNFPPYSYLEKGEPKGFNIDIIKAAAQAAGIQVDVRLGPWVTVRQSLENGELDAISGMYYSKERDKLVDFTIPHTVTTYDIFVRKGSKIFKLADIHGKDILVQEGDIMHDYLKSRKLAGRLFTVKDAPDMLNLLASGKYDGAVLPRLQGYFLMDKFGLVSIMPIGAELLPRKYCIAVREGDDVLRTQLSDGLNILKRTGQYQEIYNKWFDLSPKKMIWRTVKKYAWVTGGILAAILGMIFWFVSLKRLVRSRTAELVRANSDLRESEEKNRAILNALPDLMFLNNREGVFLECHTAVPELLMVPFEQFIGKGLDEVLPPDIAACFARFFAESFDTGKIGTFEYCMEINGKPRHFEAHIVAYEGDKVLTMIRDTTERKEMEKTLQKSEEKYRELVENTNSIILRMDGRGNVTFFNEFAQRFFGYRGDEILGRNVVGTIVPERESTGRDLRTMIEDIGLNPDRYISNINENMRRSGERVWIAWTNRPIMDENGLVREILCIGNDITDRKQAEEALVLANRQLNDIIEFLPDATYVVDKDRKIIAWNRAIEEMTGVSKESMIGQGDSVYMIPFYGERRQNLLDLLDTSSPALEARYQNVKREGTALCGSAFAPHLYGGKGGYIWVKVAPLSDPHGNRIGAISSVRDITDQKLAEEALQISEERYRIFTGITSDYVFKCSRKGTEPYQIQWMAGALESITGYSQEEIFAMGCWLRIVHPDDSERVRAHLMGLSAGQRDTSKFRIITKSADIRWIHEACICEAGPVHDQLLLYGTYQDITEQEMLYHQVLKNQKLESLGVLAGGIAHDFNNIITGIMGNISFAQMFLDSSHKSHEPLEAAEKASMRAAELARQLLTFARGGEPVKGVVSVDGIVRESVSLVLRGTKVKEIIEVPDLLHAIKADEGQIAQVFNNIAINAVQAMPGGGTLRVLAENITLDARNRQCLTAGGYIRISFSDDGCGIPDEELVNIFDPYFTTKPGGSGLGLSSVFSIVKKHGGAIEVQSKVNKGTTFTIYLPSLGRTFQEQVIGNNPLPAYPCQSGAILVMDDEEMLRSLTSHMLEHLGFEVTTCSDGEEAVMKYRNSIESGTPFSVVIMDLTIPGGMGGQEAAQKILALDPKACLIVSSGYSNDPVMSDYSSYGFCGALIKPYKAAELAKVLTALKNISESAKTEE